MPAQQRSEQEDTYGHAKVDGKRPKRPGDSTQSTTHVGGKSTPTGYPIAKGQP